MPSKANIADNLNRSAEAFESITGDMKPGHAGYRMDAESVRAYRLFLQTVEAGAVPDFPMDKWPLQKIVDEQFVRLSADHVGPEITQHRVQHWQMFAFRWLARTYPDAFAGGAADLHKVEPETDDDVAGLFAMKATAYAQACRLLARMLSDVDERWITREQAAKIIGITGASVGRQAGPEKSGKPILDNGKTSKARRFDRASVLAYTAERNGKAEAKRQETMEKVESEAEVERLMKDAGL